MMRKIFFIIVLILMPVSVFATQMTTLQSVQIYLPEPNTTTRSNIVYGRIPDNAVKVIVNGVEAELFNKIEAFIARPAFKQGENTITIQAQDVSNNVINKSQINFTYNSVTPKITITYPIDNSAIKTSPIEAKGKYAADLRYVMYNCGSAGGFTYAEKGNFKIPDLNLDSDSVSAGFIVLEVFDSNNKFYDAILIKTPQPADYRLIADPDSEMTKKIPVAGANQVIKIKLIKNWIPAMNEKVHFKVVKGRGVLLQQSAVTNSKGEATVTMTTDSNPFAENVVECYPESNPLEKVNIEVRTTSR